MYSEVLEAMGDAWKKFSTPVRDSAPAKFSGSIPKFLIRLSGRCNTSLVSGLIGLVVLFNSDSKSHGSGASATVRLLKITAMRSDVVLGHGFVACSAPVPLNATKIVLSSGIFGQYFSTTIRL